MLIQKTDRRITKENRRGWKSSENSGALGINQGELERQEE